VHSPRLGFYAWHFLPADCQSDKLVDGLICSFQQRHPKLTLRYDTIEDFAFLMGLKLMGSQRRLRGAKCGVSIGQAVRNGRLDRSLI
jgi:hypothetical protein